MRMRIYFILAVLASLMLISAGPVLCEEQNVQQEAPIVTNAPELSETQWVWGEVVSTDAPNKMLVVKYLDYETDQEKEMSITADDNTAYENIKSLDEIKPQDAVSIDYIVSPQGSNLAKNISLEKPEAQPMPPQADTGEANVQAVPNTEAGQQDVQPVVPKE